MPDYGYTIIISEMYRDSLGREITKNHINKDSPQINEINTILRKQFDMSRYDCHLDHLMLFSTKFTNFKIHYKCIYVISLEQIEHKLFLNDQELHKLLDSSGYSIKSSVYSSYPSFRFNKFHIGDFFNLDDSNNVQMTIPNTKARENVQYHGTVSM